MERPTISKNTPRPASISATLVFVHMLYFELYTRTTDNIDNNERQRDSAPSVIMANSSSVVMATEHKAVLGLYSVRIVGLLVTCL